jgi:hypothetical protein
MLTHCFGDLPEGRRRDTQPADACAASSLIQDGDHSAVMISYRNGLPPVTAIVAPET